MVHKSAIRSRTTATLLAPLSTVTINDNNYISSIEPDLIPPVLLSNLDLKSAGPDNILSNNALSLAVLLSLLFMTLSANNSNGNYLMFSHVVGIPTIFRPNILAQLDVG